MTHTTVRPLLLCALLAACGTASPSPTATSLPAEASATPSLTPAATPTRPAAIAVDAASLRGFHMQVWDAFAGAAATAFADQVALFNTVNQWGIVVYPTGYGDSASLFAAVNAGITSGQTPELAVGLPEQALAWDAAGAVVDMNPYVADPTWGLYSSGIADFPAAFWSQDTTNGRRVGLPAQRSSRFLFYDATWAHHLGFSQAPQTAEEFRQQACAANASFSKDNDPTNDGYGGWIVDSSWQTALSWMLAFGGGVVDGGSYQFRSDQNLAALQFLKKLYDDHCAWISTDPTPYDSFAGRSALFISGDLAEIPLVAEAMTRLKNTDEWTLLPFPGPEQSGGADDALVAYGPSYTMLVSTPENQLAAWLFTRWMLSPENQIAWVKQTGSLPLRSSALNLLGDYRSGQPQWAAAVADLGMLHDTPELASWRQVRYVLEDGTLSIFRTNTKVDQIPTVLAGMDAMAEELGKSP